LPVLASRGRAAGPGEVGWIRSWRTRLCAGRGRPNRRDPSLSPNHGWQVTPPTGLSRSCGPANRSPGVRSSPALTGRGAKRRRASGPVGVSGPRDPSKQGANLVLPHHREEHAVKHREMVATVSLVQDDLAGTGRGGRALGRAVKHVDLGPALVAGDLRRGQDDGRMFVPVLRVDPDLDDVPLPEGHRR